MGVRVVHLDIVRLALASENEFMYLITVVPDVNIFFSSSPEHKKN